MAIALRKSLPWKRSVVTLALEPNIGSRLPSLLYRARAKMLSPFHPRGERLALRNIRPSPTRRQRRPGDKANMLGLKPDNNVMLVNNSWGAASSILVLRI